MISVTVRIGLPLLFALVAVSCSSPSARSDRTPKSGVRGRVEFTGEVPAPRRIVVPASFGNTMPATVFVQPYPVGPTGGLGEVLVYIADPPAIAFDPPYGEALLRITNTVCQPALLAVITNQPVRFQVAGGPPLNLQAVPRAGGGWNRAVGSGSEFVVRFEQPDLHVKISENNAPWLAARIAVFDHPWFAVTDATGAFTLPPLPPGEYTLEASHRRCGFQEHKIVVTAAGAQIVLEMAPPGTAE